MSYTNAKEVFPEELLKMIQKYVDGECIYIPKKDENKAAWGTGTETKKELAKRNEQIYDDYLEGMSTKSLSEKYFLSTKTIQRIVLQKRKIYELEKAI